MVTLNAPAPAGGAVVSLSTSDQDLALVPGTVTVPQGERSATFTITAGEWWTGDVEISGTLEGITRRKMVSIVYGGWW